VVFHNEQAVLPILPYDSAHQFYNGLTQQKLVLKFYAARSNKPAWHNGQKLSIIGDSMVLFIEQMRYYGILPKNYHWREIEINRQSDNQNNSLRNDVLLTDAFLSIAKDLRYGRLNTAVKTIQDDSTQVSLLEQVLGGYLLRTALESQEPQFEGYCELKRALKILLDTLRGDDRISFMAGLENDSCLLTSKVQAIEINMERWRWDYLILGDHYIFINVPSFWLEVISNNEVVLTSKVIVGKPQRQTPLLNSLVECFTIYPYWHVPRKIAVEEYLPIIKKNTSFITKNNFDVLDHKGNILNPDSVEWKTFTRTNFPFLLRQREGPENSLGVLKFVFDNPYQVFLHDTNAKRLFKSNARALSHGCIRMEKAIELAHYLATGDLEKKSKIIETYLKQRQRHTVNLLHPIPIHVRYFTCESKGGVFFQYKDIYNMDQKLISLFY